MFEDDFSTIQITRFDELLVFNSSLVDSIFGARILRQTQITWQRKVRFNRMQPVAIIWIEILKFRGSSISMDKFRRIDASIPIVSDGFWIPSIPMDSNGSDAEHPRKRRNLRTRRRWRNASPCVGQQSIVMLCNEWQSVSIQQALIKVGLQDCNRSHSR